MEDHGTNAAVLAAILDGVVDGIITIDTRGIVQALNTAAERIFGYSADEVVGKNVSVLMPEPYHAEHNAYIERYLSTGEKRIIGIGREVRGRRKDGTTFPMRLGVSEVRDADTHLFTGIVRDISERKENERARERLIAQLEAANAELERFTYTVSHDLKSPLITIKGFLGMLEKNALDGDLDRLHSDIGRIGAAADKMKQLLDELLELSRIGRVANPPEPVSMTRLGREAAALLTGSLDERNATLTIADDLPTVYADKLRIREVLQNLIENALKFTPDDVAPEIEIGSCERDGVTTCFVRDHGIGISPEYRERVFRLFEQLDQGAGGTGIGLALVKRIVDVHGGKIWAESEGLGKGSTFYFSLPLVENSDRPAGND